MRTEQTTLNIGRIKSFDEVMQEVGMPCENSEEKVLAELVELLAKYESVSHLIWPSQLNQEFLNHELNSTRSR